MSTKVLIDFCLIVVTEGNEDEAEIDEYEGPG